MGPLTGNSHPAHGVVRFRRRPARPGRPAFAAGVAAALALGLGSVHYAVGRGTAAGEVANGPWRTSVVTGSPDADLYTRARVAVDLLLALSAPESMYFTAATDSEGRALEARCTYSLEGEELPARWWSVTSYGPDRFLIPNEASRYSLTRTHVAQTPEGSWRALVSPQLTPGNWLPSGTPGSDDTFTLTLRLFDPDPIATGSPRSIALPRVVRESCP